MPVTEQLQALPVLSPISRTTVVFSDNGTDNGKLTIAGILGQMTEDDLPAGLSGVHTIDVGALNLVVQQSEAAGVQTSVLLYKLDSDSTDTGDLDLLTYRVVYQDNIGAKIRADLWSGVPNANGSQQLTTGAPLFLIPSNPDFNLPASAYFDNASLRNGIYLNVTNLLSSPVKFSVALRFLEVPPPEDPVTIPPYTDAGFTYTGPSGLATADAGVGQTFPEPAYAMQYLASGATLTIHPGTYFKPFTVTQPLQIKASDGASAETVRFDLRGGWVTGYPTWPDNNPVTQPPANPFRLAQGKGGILVHSDGVTIDGIGFLNGGGGYGVNSSENVGDGESGAYAENFTGHVYFTRCTFDGCENGIFLPPDQTGNTVIAHIHLCTFSQSVPNGQTPDGLSHNIYVHCGEIHVIGSAFYGCFGNTLKTRSLVTLIDDSHLEQGGGRAIDQPNGGVLAVRNCTLSQNPAVSTQNNFLGLANELAQISDPDKGDSHSTFDNCTIQIFRYNTAIFIQGSGSQADFAPPLGTPSTMTWYEGLQGSVLVPNLSYDTEDAGGLASGVINIPFSPQDGGTIAPSGTVAPRPTPVHVTGAPILCLRAPVAPSSTIPFAVVVESAGYPFGTVPTGLEVSVDGGAFAALTSVVSTSRFQTVFNLAQLTAGQHSVKVRDGSGTMSHLVQFVTADTGSGGGGGGGGSGATGGYTAALTVGGYTPNVIQPSGNTLYAHFTITATAGNVPQTMEFDLVPDGVDNTAQFNTDRGNPGVLGPVVAPAPQFVPDVLDYGPGTLPGDYAIEFVFSTSTPTSTPYHYWLRIVDSRATPYFVPVALNVNIGDSLTTNVVSG